MAVIRLDITRIMVEPTSRKAGDFIGLVTNKDRGLPLNSKQQLLFTQPLNKINAIPYLLLCVYSFTIDHKTKLKPIMSRMV